MILRLFALCTGFCIFAGAQSVVLTGSGNLTATPIENSLFYNVTGTGTATLTGYGAANMTITGSAEPGNVVLTMSLDFGGGNVLRGTFGIDGYVLESDYSESTYSSFQTGAGTGEFANEIGWIYPAMSLTLSCQTPTHPCSATMSGPFSLAGNGLISPEQDRAAISFSKTDITVAAGQGADQVIAADLNGDGKTDLAVFSISAGILTILLGNGDGTFQSATHTYTNLSASPHSIAVGDFNGDRKPDILLADYNNLLYAMLGNGDGSFEPPKLALQNVTCCSIAVGDWNVDKRLDIATPGQSFLGNGDGTFDPATYLTTSSVVNIAVTTADLNHDGKADLIVTDYSQLLLLVFLGNGDGTFQAPKTVQASITPGALAVGDLNGDGIPDLAFADGPNTYFFDVFLGNGDGGFRPSIVIRSLDLIPPATPALSFADIDRDGKLDMIAATFTGIVGSGTADIYLGKGDGTFLVPVSFPLNNSPTSMVITDLNMDGKPDIITTSSVGAGLTILMNTSVLSSVSGLPAVNTNPASVTVAVGQTATFNASAVGTPTPTVQWQVSTDNGASFDDIPGATSGTYSFITVPAENGNQYRAVFTNSAGSVTSSAATLTDLSAMLTIQKTHTGDFLSGQMNAAYQVTVTNIGTQPTNGVVTVAEKPSSGLTLVSMNGSGWTCPGTAANNCTRSDALGVGLSYPSIHVTVNVAANTTSPQVNAVSLSGGGSAPAGAADSTVIVGAAPSGLGLFTLTPCRAVDTRTSQGKSGDYGPPQLPASSTRDFSLPLSGCGVPNQAEAYSLNFTVVPPGPLQYLSVWPTGEPYPGVSTLNSPDGSTLANAAIVPAGPQSGTTVSASNPTDLIIDVNGYFASPDGNELAFYPMTPCRVVDTRSDQHKTGDFGPPSLVTGAERNFPLLMSTCNIPNTAKAYSLNLTVVPLGPLQYLSTWPADKGYPNVSTLNSPDGSTIANAAIVPAAANGDITVLAGGATDFIIDINGYFAAPGTPGALHFYAMTPCRVADTRSSQPFSGAFGPPSLAASTTRDFPLESSACGIPATAQAYSLNFTVVPQGPLQYLSVWPSGQPYPNVSTLNSPKGTTLANAAIVPAGINGAIVVMAGSATDLIIDINGYFAP